MTTQRCPLQKAIVAAFRPAFPSVPDNASQWFLSPVPMLNFAIIGTVTTSKVGRGVLTAPPEHPSTLPARWGQTRPTTSAASPRVALPPSARPLECGDSSPQPGGLMELSRGQRPRKQPPVKIPPRRGGGTSTLCPPAPLRGACPIPSRPGALPPAKFRRPSGPGIFPFFVVPNL